MRDQETDRGGGSKIWKKEEDTSDLDQTCSNNIHEDLPEVSFKILKDSPLTLEVPSGQFC